MLKGINSWAHQSSFVCIKSVAILVVLPLISGCSDTHIQETYITVLSETPSEIVIKDKSDINRGTEIVRDMARDHCARYGRVAVLDRKLDIYTFKYNCVSPEQLK